MQELYIDEILESCGGTLLSGNPKDKVISISTNSNDITEGALFVPICGERTDAHNYIDVALKNGAAATLTQKHVDIQKGRACILVEDTKLALQKIARYYRSKFNIPFIGVTGSAGKTSTKEMIASVLSIKFKTMKTTGNQNSQIGLPLTIFQLDGTHEAAVIEMGISEFDEMERLADIAKPNYAVVTNIGISHIENLKTQQNIRDEKLKIISSFDKNGILFINADEPLLYDIKDSVKTKVVTFGTQDGCDFRAENIEMDGLSTKFKLISPDGNYDVKIPVLGMHNVYNALAAIAVGTFLNLSMNKIQEGLSNYRGIAMRQQIRSFKDLVVIDDSYNANPSSMKSAIDVLVSLKAGMRTIAILADMLELGEKSREAHFRIGKYAAEKDIDVIIAVGIQAEQIFKGYEHTKNTGFSRCFKTNEDAIKYLDSIKTNGDRILIKGSRGMHTEEIVKYLLRDK